MNSLLLDIANQLRNSLKLQEGLNGYLIKAVKTYYDLEGSLRIAVKVYNRAEEKDEVIILGADLLADLTDENEEKWFEELN
ncbi:MAG: hypothetical protein J6G98_00760 [Bacilli bacterium]|jgi:hypothetical protein|nr:hypothetical protein [Bacilli bacterium]